MDFDSVPRLAQEHGLELPPEAELADEPGLLSSELQR